MKRIVLTTIQILVTVTLLWWVFHDPQKRADMWKALQTAQYSWLVLGVICIGGASLLQTERWRILLNAQGINMGWARTLRVYLIGAFFNLFLPGGTGGDVVKIFYSMRETKSKSAAFLSVLVDRMMGLLGLVAATCALCFLRIDLLISQPITRALLLPLGIILGGSVGMILAGFLLDRLNLVHKIPHWMPLRSKLLDFAAAFTTYARSPRVLAATFGLSIPAHCLIFLAFYFAARSFGLFGSWEGLLDFFSVLPPIMTFAALPISVAGMGVREQLFQNVFGELFHTPLGTAAMISLGGFFMQAFWGLVGGVIYLLYRPTGGIHLDEVAKEVEEAEQSIEEQA